MSFMDADLDLGQIGGLLRWDPPADIGALGKRKNLRMFGTCFLFDVVGLGWPFVRQMKMNIWN